MVREFEDVFPKYLPGLSGEPNIDFACYSLVFTLRPITYFCGLLVGLPTSGLS